VGTEEEEVEDEVSSSELELLPNICIKELNILNFFYCCSCVRKEWEWESKSKTK
jgi:hypothetical protein